MKPILSLILACLISGAARSGSVGADTSLDREQEYLELNYRFDNQWGVRLDTMENLPLHKEICTWIGAPYRYSGETMDGIDCSGFVSCIYRIVFEQPLAASSKDIYEENVVPIKKSELKEGDLVFFKIRRKTVSHVGIYLGENLFVHASTKQGVVVSSLKEAYYAKYFYKGGRIKN